MALTTFGAIFNFAERLETEDGAFFAGLAASSRCDDRAGLFARFARDAGKNLKTAQRTRRENVTEMILEAIQGFSRNPYELSCGDPAALDRGEALAAARRLEQRAENFYLAAAEKLGTMAEVSRALKMLAKKHRDHLKALDL